MKLLFLHSIDVSIEELRETICLLPSYHQLFNMYINIILELGTSACLRVIWF